MCAVWVLLLYLTVFIILITLINLKILHVILNIILNLITPVIIVHNKGIKFTQNKKKVPM